MDPGVSPACTKIHLATWNGEENPLDEFLAGRFDEWQRWQTKRNFERPFVLALISLPGANRWLYAGVHGATGSQWHEEYKLFHYNMIERPSCAEFNGRLVVSFTRPGRQSYLNAENWTSNMLIAEILPERMKISEFPGYREINLAKSELDLVVKQGLESWRTALSNVAGIYLISDTLSGKIYVGSASGEGGIWQRWCQYATSGHGGNLELKRIIEKEGIARANDFLFSVLEIADLHTGVDEILRRESHWKNILLTRSHGLNAN